jgi:dTMP kinase
VELCLHGRHLGWFLGRVGSAEGSLLAHYVGLVGRFIVLEGGEAVGKSTQAARLAAYLGAVLTREPGGTAIGEALRRLLLDPSLPTPVTRAETLLMLAARAQHVAEVIGPALARGQDVVCDRYSGSTLAYQGCGRGLDLDELRQLDRWATAGRLPDRVVLLDLPVELARERREGGPEDRFEGEDDGFRQRVRVGFLELAAADPVRWRTVDASRPVDEVATAVIEAAAAGPEEATGR